VTSQVKGDTETSHVTLRSSGNPTAVRPTSLVQPGSADLDPASSGDAISTLLSLATVGDVTAIKQLCNNVSTINLNDSNKVITSLIISKRCQ
jgi:hypothetical protein